MKLRYLVLAGFLISFLVVGIIIYLSYSSPTKWIEPVLYPGAQQVSTQRLDNGQVKITTFVINEARYRQQLTYASNLERLGWTFFTTTRNGLITSYAGGNPTKLEYIDKSKDVRLQDLTIIKNKCKAFLLDILVEDAGPEQTRVTLTQQVGPCGEAQS